MQKLKILWVDDEIERLKSFVMFLTEKGYEVETATNGSDAIAMVVNNKYDLVLLDEMMPGLDGLATLKEIKKINSAIPVVMVTKSEEEGLMNDAIAGHIADYLIKPINPNQIIMAIKKIFHTDEIRRNRIGKEYAGFANKLNQALFEQQSWQKWNDIYKDICHWDNELDEIADSDLKQTHFLQKKNSNEEFFNFISENYQTWLHSDDRPTLSFDLIYEYLLPMMKKNKPVYFIVIDCMRLDQYYALESFIKEFFNIEMDLYYSILPTATPYSRNSIFSGLLPKDIAKHYPQYWQDTGLVEDSRNRNEHQLLDKHLADLGLDINTRYVKIYNVDEGKYVNRKINSWKKENLVVLVYNFLDLLAHHRSKSQILRETIPDASAFRAFTKHWFLHSTLYSTLKLIREQGASIVITTDHGSIRVTRATKIVGEKDTTTTIRYKQGKNLSVNQRNVLLVKNPDKFGLPQRNIVDNYVFAKDDYYFVYPNAYHKYQKQFNGTFQHGGISMEEMILPIAVGSPK